MIEVLLFFVEISQIDLTGAVHMAVHSWEKGLEEIQGVKGVNVILDLLSSFETESHPQLARWSLWKTAHAVTQNKNETKKEEKENTTHGDCARFLPFLRCETLNFFPSHPPTCLT